VVPCDALLGRRSEYLDLDFVLPVGAVKTARAIAKRCQAGFVLDAERQIARVVFKLLLTLPNKKVPAWKLTFLGGTLL